MGPLRPTRGPASRVAPGFARLARMPSKSTLLEAVNASQDALVERDIQKYLSLLAEDVVLEDASASNPIRGRDSARHFIGGLLGAFSELKFTERTALLLGGRVALRFTLEFKTAAGKPGSFAGVNVFEFDEAGKITRLANFYDLDTLAAALRA